MGVVSFGIGCARANYNGVYARVSSVTEWIKESICELSAYPPDYCPTRPNNGGIGSGNGKVRIDIKYDDYAHEVALSFVHDATGKQIYFQPFFSEDAKNRAEVWKEWSDLPAGDYTIMVGDQARDGLW